jgi:hypothetical protein
MEDLLVKLALGQKITDEDLENALYEVCDDVHSSCNSSCPINRLNGGEVPNTLPNNRGCDCFKNGKAMLKFIREIYSREKK